MAAFWTRHSEKNVESYAKTDLLVILGGAESITRECYVTASIISLFGVF